MKRSLMTTAGGTVPGRTWTPTVPNAARPRYFLEKLLDAALAAVTTVAMVVILVFLAVLA